MNVSEITGHGCLFLNIKAYPFSTVQCTWDGIYKRCFMFILTNLKMPLLIYFSLYLVIIDFMG